jgi:hypothetical protein
VLAVVVWVPVVVVAWVLVVVPPPAPPALLPHARGWRAKRQRGAKRRRKGVRIPR